MYTYFENKMAAEYMFLKENINNYMLQVLLTASQQPQLMLLCVISFLLLFYTQWLDKFYDSFIYSFIYLFTYLFISSVIYFGKTIHLYYNCSNSYLSISSDTISLSHGMSFIMPLFLSLTYEFHFCYFSK